MYLFQAFIFVALFAQACLAQQPIEVYQRWLMIIKTAAQAGGPWVGNLNQGDIDRARTAFTETFPRTIRDLTDGRVEIETQVRVSDRPLTSIDTGNARGMVRPEHMQADVDEWVVPEQFDSVAVYNAFNEHAYWGTATGAGVGWFSVSNAQDLSYNSVSMASWVHESLHTQGWYYADERLGPTSPVCPQQGDGRDGVHCAEAYGYTRDGDGLPDFLAYYRDFLNGEIEGGLGLGSKAWAFGSRVEAARGVPPGSTIPNGMKAKESGEREVTSSNSTGISSELWD